MAYTPLVSPTVSLDVHHAVPYPCPKAHSHISSHLGLIDRVRQTLQMQHADLLGLPDAVGAGDGLLLVLGVRVGVVDDHLGGGESEG